MNERQKILRLEFLYHTAAAVVAELAMVDSEIQPLSKDDYAKLLDRFMDKGSFSLDELIQVAEEVTAAFVRRFRRAQLFMERERAREVNPAEAN